MSTTDAITITRDLPAPAARIFSAWTDQSQLARWWAPRGFTTPFCTVDPRPGGHFRFCMRSPEGRDFWGRGTYTEIVKPSRIVYTDVFTDPDGNPVPPSHYGMSPAFPHEARVSVELAERGGRTRLTLRHDFPASVPEFADCRDGWNQLLDRLTELFADPETFTLCRTLNAPRERVFRAWTELDQLRPWWGPKGFPLADCSLDLRPGGAFHYQLKSAGGNEMWGKWVYREVAPPERLVLVSSFSDPQGRTARAPFSDDWPLETLTTFTFAEDGDRTIFTLAASPMNATDAERKAFADMHGSMRAGWGGTLDQLADYLARA